VTLKEFGAAWNARLAPKLAYLTACAFIAAAVVGSLTFTSCAHTEAGLARETQLYLSTSNATQNLRQVVPYVPAPANSLLEGILAAGGALLAVWATHLHRSLNEVRNGNSSRPPPGSPPPAATG
jgi:hypothetical protein